MKKKIIPSLLLITGSAFAQLDLSEFNVLKVNVSQIVTGQYQPVDWSKEAASGISLGRSAYNNDYSTLSSIWHLKMPVVEYAPQLTYQPFRFAGPSWPPAWADAQVAPASIERNQKTPAPVIQDGTTTQYNQPFYMQAQVSFPSPNTVAARVSHGEAQTRLNYRIRSKNNQQTALDFFLAFGLPTISRSVHVATSLCCSGDPNGGTYTYKTQQWASSRASFDVRVDGLPVFSSASMYDFPEDYRNGEDYYTGNQYYPNHYAWDKIENRFGAQPLATQKQAKLYLGKIPAGKEIVVDIVFHSDARAKAPSCGTSGGGYYDPIVKRDCYELTETLSVPMNAAQEADFRVYGKLLE
jgi:hypothetical protein